MNCRKCKAEIPDESKFCLECGAKQAQEARKALKRANGLGTVYKLQGRRRRPWVIAKNKVIIGYFETKTAALEALSALSGRNIDERYNMTFAEVYEAWSGEHFIRLTKSGQESYRNSFKAFADLHDKKFRSLRTSDFQRIINNNSEKREMIKKYRLLLNHLSKWAMREGIITTNYAQFVELYAAPKKEKVIFTDDEIARIEEEAKTDETARIVCMLLSTGMRIGELFSLRTSDYHGDYVIGGSKTEAGRNRTIPIRPEGRRHFEFFASRSNDKELLLDGYTGNSDISNFRSRDYSRLLKRLDIDSKKTPHATRHTYASRAVKEGMPPEILQKIMGHAQYSTTVDIYTHMDARTLVDAVEKSVVTNMLLTDS